MTRDAANATIVSLFFSKSMTYANFGETNDNQKEKGTLRVLPNMW